MRPFRNCDMHASRVPAQKGTERTVPVSQPRPDATQLWGLNESTLRKAIAYGKLVNGVDACKYGKQWVISTEAMKREY